MELHTCQNPNCGKEFVSKRNSKGKYCSHKCVTDNMHHRFTSDNNPGFKKGDSPWNKGKKTNGKPANIMEVGTIVTRNGRGKNEIEGRKYIKTENGKWVRYDIYIWEINNGPIPKGYVIKHKNNSQEDCSLSNLELKKSGIDGRNHKIPCKNCTEIFVAKELTQKFCCVDCYKEHCKKKSTQICINSKCGKEFYGKGERKFCSVKCCVKYKSDHDMHGGFKKGRIPWNKGKKGYLPEAFKKNMFKKGNVPKNKAKVGTIVLRKRNNQKYPRTYIKIAQPSTWIKYNKCLNEKDNGHK